MPNIASSVTASIVLYKTPFAKIIPLISALAAQGVAKIYVIDNSPLSFDTIGKSKIADYCEYIRAGANVGYGRGHNIAIQRSVGLYDYHLICNPDIGLRGSLISEMVSYMNTHQDVGLSMPKIIGTDGKMQYCCRRSPVPLDYVSQVICPGSWGKRRAFRLEMRDLDYDLEMEVQCLSGCFMFFRSSVLMELRGFDEQFFLYFEDFDLSMRSSRLARNVYLPSSSVVHERQSAHRKSWRLKIAFAVSAMRYFLKWGILGNPEMSRREKSKVPSRE
jgi:GT2 family glycosyltransferase